jgi:Cu/Ag efflux protein CusF
MRLTKHIGGVLIMRRNITFAIMGAMAAIVATALAIRVAADAPAHQLYIYSGTLRSVDLQARTISVDMSSVPQKFTVPTDAEIIVKDKPKGSLSDLMVGDAIQVKYTDEDGVYVAHQISVLGVKVP